VIPREAVAAASPHGDQAQFERGSEEHDIRAEVAKIKDIRGADPAAHEHSTMALV